MDVARQESDRRWFSGFVIGLVVGLGALVAGTIAWSIGLVVTAMVCFRPGRTAAIGGVLAGFGACWLALFSSAGMRCGPGCSMPDLAPWIVASAVVFVVGVAITAFVWSRQRR